MSSTAFGAETPVACERGFCRRENVFSDDYLGHDKICYVLSQLFAESYRAVNFHF